MTELLPCPFCGSEPNLEYIGWVDENRYVQMKVNKLRPYNITFGPAPIVNAYLPGQNNPIFVTIPDYKPSITLGNKE